MILLGWASALASQVEGLPWRAIAAASDCVAFGTIGRSSEGDSSNGIPVIRLELVDYSVVRGSGCVGDTLRVVHARDVLGTGRLPLAGAKALVALDLAADGTYRLSRAHLGLYYDDGVSRTGTGVPVAEFRCDAMAVVARPMSSIRLSEDFDEGLPRSEVPSPMSVMFSDTPELVAEPWDALVGRAAGCNVAVGSDADVTESSR